MMLPSLGSVFGVLVYILSLATDDGKVSLILVGAALQGIMGKSSVITMAVNSYVTDISEVDDRTKTLGKLLAMSFFGLFAGSLLSGVMQDMTDMLTTFFVVVILHAAVVVITIFVVNDSVVYKHNAETKNNFVNECRAIFRLSNIKDSFMVLMRKRRGNASMLILLMFGTTILNQTCKSGEMDVTVLFVTRNPLSWPKSWYGYLLSVDYAVMGSSLFLLLPLLTNVFKMPDAGILLIGIGCKVIRLVWAGFCTDTWMVFTSVIIGAFAGMITIALRSLLSKSVEEDEAGKIFSLLACGETLSKLLGVLVFINLYSATASKFPGFAYMIEACIYAIMLILVAASYWDLKKVGNFNIKAALTDHTRHGTTRYHTAGTGHDTTLSVLDELDEELHIAAPLLATTP